MKRSTTDPADADTARLDELQAEIDRLEQVLRGVSQEKERALRLLRRSNTNLDGRVRDQFQQLATLKHLVTTINASLDLNQVAATAIVGLEMLVGVQAAALAWVDGAGEVGFLAARPETWWATLGQVRFSKGQGIIGGVIESGHAHVTADAIQDPVFRAETDAPSGVQAQSILCQPLIIHDRVVGALQLVNKWTGPFSDSDRNFVETVAGSLATAMENARMYEQVQAQLADLAQKNAQLVATQAQLIQSEKLASIGLLTAGLTHEINNPIGIIVGFAQLINQREQDERLKQYADLILRESLRVKRIVDNLLEFAHDSTLELKLVNLENLIDKVIGLTGYQVEREGIRLTHPHSDEPVWVMADANQLLQVLLNLIQNARQAMPGGGELTLRVWSEAGQGMFSVADTGHGIPAAIITKIFDPFFTTKPVGQGTGLGLSVSYGIVTRHGGDIQVSSTPGAGATFVVRLPLSTQLPPP
ncbi:MAG: ATP-binding protein [Chloroflexi bacterium]|nr:ATP-binding protein [Chloroflexota bacterium]